MRQPLSCGGAASAVGAVFLAVSSVPALAAEPIGEWKIEPSDVRCVAVRKYGDPDKPITLALRSPAAGNSVQLAIIRNGYRNSSSQNGAKVDIDGHVFSTFALGYPLGYPARTSKQTVSLINLPPDAAAAIRGAANVGVNIKGSPDDNFPLGRIQEAWTSMEGCLDHLRAVWNIGSDEKIATLAQPLVPIEGMLSPRDFPPQIQNVWTGSTSFLLLIDENGSVKDCTLTESSGVAVIDSRTCAVISYKARFSPAVGADGKPIRSTYARRVTWAMTN